jgi:hypothetical protein
VPNYCENGLTIKGPKDALDDITSTGFSMQRFVPMPEALAGIVSGATKVDGIVYFEWRDVDGKSVPVTAAELQSLQEQYGATNWYGWNIANWGAKWDAKGEWTRLSDTEAFVSFHTAWSPPEAFVRRLAALYPQVSFRLAFCEQGYDFYGWVLFDWTVEEKWEKEWRPDDSPEDHYTTFDHPSKDTCPNWRAGGDGYCDCGTEIDEYFQKWMEEHHVAGLGG